MNEPQKQSETITRRQAGLLFNALDDKQMTDGLGALNEEQKHFFVVWASSGVIDNGGFVLFFEQELYEYDVVEAYRAMGLGEAASVIAKALGLFPESLRRKPDDYWKPDEYMKALEEHEVTLEGLTKEYWSASAELDASVSLYVARNWSRLRQGLD